MAQWLSWLERRPVTAEVESSSLFWVVVWGLSSAGRASALQAEGHRFEPYRPHFFVYFPENQDDIPGRFGKSGVKRHLVKYIRKRNFTGCLLKFGTGSWIIRQNYRSPWGSEPEGSPGGWVRKAARAFFFSAHSCGIPTVPWRKPRWSQSAVPRYWWG